MGEMKVTQPAVMQDRTVLTNPGQPGGDGAFTMPKHALGRSDGEPFRHCAQDFSDA
jgi:hypothetical protein